MAGALGVRPRVAQEGQEARVVDGGDRRLAVLGRCLLVEAAVGGEGGADPLGPRGHLVRRDLDAQDRLARDRVVEVSWRVDDAHGR